MRAAGAPAAVWNAAGQRGSGESCGDDEFCYGGYKSPRLYNNDACDDGHDETGSNTPDGEDMGGNGGADCGGGGRRASDRRLSDRRHSCAGHGGDESNPEPAGGYGGTLSGSGANRGSGSGGGSGNGDSGGLRLSLLGESAEVLSGEVAELVREAEAARDRARRQCALLQVEVRAKAAEAVRLQQALVEGGGSKAVLRQLRDVERQLAALASRNVQAESELLDFREYMRR
ncbi:unnamed protein product, partial [Phaeothamnion confervicola]